MAVQIPDLLAKVKRLKLRNEVKRQIQQDFSDEIIALNQRQLFSQSIDSKGVPLLLYRSVGYSLDKEKRNPLPGFGRPDLYDTGAFYSKFVVRVTSSEFIVSSTDSKTKSLVAKYGEDIFGLTQESKGELAQGKLFQGIKRYIESTTGLKMV